MSGLESDKKPILRDEKGYFQEGTASGPGRPKGSKNFSTLFDEAIEELSIKEGITSDEAEKRLIIKAYNEARAGNFNFYRDTMDRRYGKPPQDFNVGGQRDNPIRIIEVAIDEDKTVSTTG